jgi:uncharacterized membrane protein (DUF373 family)
MPFEQIREYLRDNKYYIELPIAVAMFIYAMITDSLIELIIYMLYFIIFLEIVRSVIEFTKGHRIKIRVLVDAFIILSLREFIVNVAKLGKQDYASLDAMLSSNTIMQILAYSVVILFLFFTRYLAIKTSPEKYDCQQVQMQKDRLTKTKDTMQKEKDIEEE